MSNLRIEVKGLAELKQNLSDFEPKLRNDVYRAALKASGIVLAEGMAAQAPRAQQHQVKRGGKPYPYPLYQSIGNAVYVSSNDARVDVGPMYRAFWGKFQELGTRYQTARHFMTESFQNYAPAALQALEETMREAIAAMPLVGRGAPPTT